MLGDLYKSSKKSKSLSKKIQQIVESNKIDVFKKLLSQHPEIPKAAYEPFTSALHLCCDYKRDEMSMLLLELGADPFAPDSLGRLPYHLSVSCPLVFDAIVKKKRPDQLTITCNAGNGILHYLALRYCKIDAEILAYLMKIGLDINLQNGTGDTALHFCCKTNHVELATLLLKHGANVNIENDRKELPLVIALECGSIPIARKMLKDKSLSLTPCQKKHCLSKVDHGSDIYSTLSDVKQRKSGKRTMIPLTKHKSLSNVKRSPRSVSPIPRKLNSNEPRLSLSSSFSSMEYERERSQSFSQITNRILIMDEYSQEKTISDSEDSDLQMKSKIKEDLLIEISAELQSIIDAITLSEICVKIFESKSFSWSPNPGENKIEVLKWIAEFIVNGQRQEYLRYLKKAYSSEIKISKKAIKSKGKHRILTMKEKRILSFDWEIDKSDLTIGEFIGAGSFGCVYFGSYKSCRKKVAIKSLSDLSEEHLHSFVKEVSIISRLKHSNIVQFLGASLDDDMVIVMEYAELGDLKSYLKNNSVSFETKVQFALEIASGMEYLHEQPIPIVHRDLKCQNILVTQKQVLKVSDFGLSKFSDKAVTDGSRIGSLNWLAPEVLRGGAISVKPVDVYAFGMTMYELLMDGGSPYEGLPPLQIIKLIDEKSYPMIPEDCNPVYRTLMERCWEESQYKRPSFSDLKHALSSLLRDLKLLNSPTKFKKRHDSTNKKKEKPPSGKLEKRKS